METGIGEMVGILADAPATLVLEPLDPVDLFLVDAIGIVDEPAAVR